MEQYYEEILSGTYTSQQEWLQFCQLRLQYAGARKTGSLRRMVTSYFTNSLLKYDTKNGPKEYKISGGVPQGSVLGLLWNIMYDGLQRLALPGNVNIVAYADDGKTWKLLRSKLESTKSHHNVHSVSQGDVLRHLQWEQTCSDWCLLLEAQNRADHCCHQ